MSKNEESNTKCPRTKCDNDAVINRRFGVLPCRKCQEKDILIDTRRKYEFASVDKLHRVQGQRDRHGGDMLQPFIGDKVNPEFFKRYPEKVDSYGVQDELEKV